MKKYLFFLSTLLLNNSLIAQDNSNLLWSVELQQPVNISPVYNADKIFIATENGLILYLDKNGKEKMNYAANSEILNPPIIEQNVLFFGTSDGDIFSLNVNTFYLYQVIGIGESITPNLVIVNIELNGLSTKGVVAGTEFGNIYCYDISTFEPIWTNQISDTSIISPIVSSDHQIFFLDGKRNLYCVSANNGLLIWKITPEEFGWKTIDQFFRSDIVLSGYNIYLTDSSGKLFCIDAMLGTINWSIKNIFSNGIIKLRNKNELVLPTFKNKIVIVSPSQQKVIKEIELPIELKNESITDQIAIDEKIIAGFTNGMVYQMDSKGKAELIFSGTSSIISLLNVNGDCLVTDSDGNITLLSITE